MVFCRCCGKEIHQSAPACPQCGGLQNVAAAVAPVAAKTGEPGLWVPITALIGGIIGAAAILDDKIPDRDTTVGIITAGIIGIVFGVVSIRNQSAGKKMAIAAIILSVIAILGLIGMHSE
jgi:hypothetical protein